MSRLEYIKEEIRQRVSITQIVERYTNRRIVKGVCNCPLHTEKTASFSVDEDKGLYYCFGCGAGGDIFKFVQTYLGISFKEAVAQIDQDFALGITGEKISVKAQIAMREVKKKRAIEEYTKMQNNLLYNELCAQYRAIDNLVRVLEPFTYIWDKMITRKAWLESELDRLL